MKLRFWQSDDYDTPPPYFITEETKNRAGGRAWVLALATFLATLLVLFLLFASGRWIYRQFTKDKKATTTTSQISETTNTVGEQAGVGATSTPTPSTIPTATPTPTPSSTSQSSTASTNASDSTTAASGKSTNDLPKTGIDGEE